MLVDVRVPEQIQYAFDIHFYRLTIVRSKEPHSHRFRHGFDDDSYAFALDLEDFFGSRRYTSGC